MWMESVLCACGKREENGVNVDAPVKKCACNSLHQSSLQEHEIGSELCCSGECRCTQPSLPVPQLEQPVDDEHRLW